MQLAQVIAMPSKLCSNTAMKTKLRKTQLEHLTYRVSVRVLKNTTKLRGIVAVTDYIYT